MPKAMPPARKQPGGGRDIVSRGYFTTFGGVRRGEFARGEYPGRGASANPSNSGGFWGVGGAQGKRAGDYPPRTFPARPGAIFARFAGSGSPPSASARPASRSPESARGANSPNALARGGGKQSRPAQQGKFFRFSARPSAFGGFGRMRRRWPRPRAATAAVRRVRGGERPLIRQIRGVLGGQAGRKGKRRGIIPPDIPKPVEGRFSRLAVIALRRSRAASPDSRRPATPRRTIPPVRKRPQSGGVFAPAPRPAGKFARPLRR